MDKPVLLYYCRHNDGIGGHARIVTIAERLTERFRVVVLNGGPLPACSNMPGNIDFVPEITNEPEQIATRQGPFDVVVNDVKYQIEPEYAYDLTGMIVSYRHHEGNSRMHMLANDHLNMLDVCVVWGDNTASQLYKIDFWNGIFT